MAKHKKNTTTVFPRKDSAKQPTPPAQAGVQGDTSTMPLEDAPDSHHDTFDEAFNQAVKDAGPGGSVTVEIPADGTIDQRRQPVDLNEKLFKMFASIEFSSQLDGSRRILLRGGRRYNGVRRTFQTLQEMLDYVGSLDLA